LVAAIDVGFDDRVRKVLIDQAEISAFGRHAVAVSGWVGAGVAAG
jgi:hypothetical protein